MVSIEELPSEKIPQNKMKNVLLLLLVLLSYLHKRLKVAETKQWVDKIIKWNAIYFLDIWVGVGDGFVCVCAQTRRVMESN